MTKKLKTSQGFTLIETLIVVAILAILAAIALPIYNQQKTRAMQAGVAVYLNGLADQATSHYAFYGYYPTLAELGITVASAGGGSGGGGYMGFQLPNFGGETQPPPAPTPPPPPSGNPIDEQRIANGIAGTNTFVEIHDEVFNGYHLRFIWFALSVDPVTGKYENVVGLGHPIQSNTSSFAYTLETWFYVVADNAFGTGEKSTWMLELGQILPYL